MTGNEVMNFGNVNILNIRLNMISGNMSPTNTNESEFSPLMNIYKIGSWIMQFIYAIVMLIAVPYVSLAEIIQNTVVCVLILWEVGFISSRMYLSKKQVLDYIQQINDILANADELMKTIVKTTLKPVVLPLAAYCIFGSIVLIIWAAAPYVMAFQQNSFRYEDFRVPVAFTKQPFSAWIFVITETFVLIACLNLFLKKVATDVYLIHLVMLLTSQYRYLSTKLAIIFRGEKENDEEPQKQSDPKTDLMITFSSKEEMIILCRHYNTVIYIASILKEILSLNFSVIYLNNVFRFCVLAVMIVSGILDGTYLESYLLAVYLLSSLTQLYILCFCSQQLLDTSKKITDKTFHKKWYLFGLSQKRMLLFLMMGSELECNLSAFENFSLNLSSFMTILNQSYSISLLFLKFRMNGMEK